MRRTVLIASLLGAAFLSAVSASSACAGEGGTLEEARLGQPGAVWRTKVTVTRPALVVPRFLLASSYLGNIWPRLRTEAGDVWPGDLDTEPVPAGSYVLELTADGASEDPFWVRIDQVPDPLAEAKRIAGPDAAQLELPGRYTLELAPSGNPRTFLLSPDRAGILSVHVSGRGKAEVFYEVGDGRGNRIYGTRDAFDADGARYMAVEPGPYVLAIRSMDDVQIDLDVDLLEPESVEVKDGGILTLGMEPDSENLRQMRLMARAASVPLLSMLSPEGIAAVLIETAQAPPPRAAAPGTPRPGPRPERPSGSGGAGWVWVLGAVLGTLAGLAAWLRRRGSRSA